MRDSVSVAPPAGKPLTYRTDLTGQASCDSAMRVGSSGAANEPPTMVSKVRRFTAIGAGLPKKGIIWPVPVISRSIAVITISCSRRACSTLRMPPWSSVRTLIPSLARVSRYHSNSARGSSSSAKKLTGDSVAAQIADTTSYEPMWQETTSTPLPTARASSR